MKIQKSPTQILFFQDRKCLTDSDLNELTKHGIRIIYNDKEISLFNFAQEATFDFVLFDLTHASEKEKEHLRRLKEEGTPHPIIFCYQEVSELDFFNTIKSSDDDILKSPIIIQELIFKIKKNQKDLPMPEINQRLGPFTIDPKARLVQYMNQFKKLGRREFQILLFLAQKKDEVVSREKILEHLYHQVDLYDRTIDSHISHLRKKLWDLAGPTLQIISVYGHGYRIFYTDS